jgi:hypothetical protein
MKEAGADYVVMSIQDAVREVERLLAADDALPGVPDPAKGHSTDPDRKSHGSAEPAFSAGNS